MLIMVFKPLTKHMLLLDKVAMVALSLRVLKEAVRKLLSTPHGTKQELSAAPINGLQDLARENRLSGVLKLLMVSLS